MAKRRTVNTPPPDNRTHGVVKWFDNKKGFGFIMDGNQKEYFVHYTAITSERRGYRSLHEAQAVTFVASDGDKGLRALEVQPS